MRCPTVGDQFARDAHGVIDRNGETQSDRAGQGGTRAFNAAHHRLGGVDTDEPAVRVDECAAGITPG